MSKSVATTNNRIFARGGRGLRFTACILAALLAYAALPAFSDDEPRDTDFERGVAATEEKDYETALKRFKKSAEKGNSVSMYNVGVFYENGWGVEMDKAEAFKWYLKSAENGFPKAQYEVNIAYEFGIGVEKNSDEMYKWLKKAAENKYPDAVYTVGRVYALGIHEDQNIEKAVKCFTEAIELGCINACVDLGKLYLDGNGVEQDFTKAAKLFLVAAKEKNEEGAFQLAECYRKKLVNAEDIEQISMKGSGPFDSSGNYKGAQKWYLVAAEQGNVEAQYRYGSNEMVLKAAKNGHLWAMYKAATNDYIPYHKGDWAKDIKSAQYKDPENPDLLFWLGVGYQNGMGMNRDSKKAWSLFVEAGKKGNAWSQNHIGEVLLNGDRFLGVEKDEKNAFGWFKLAAEQGYAMGQFNLAECYNKGKGVEEDEEESIKWYKKAVEPRYSDCYGNDNEKANALAADQLGKCYEKGWGVEKNPEQAFLYYLMSMNIQATPKRKLKVAQCYENGMGTQYNPDAAEQIYFNLSNGRPSSDDRKEWAEANYKVAMLFYAPKIESQQYPSSDYMEDMEFHLKNAAKEGHEEAQKYCRDHNISWDR